MTNAVTQIGSTTAGGAVEIPLTAIVLDETTQCRCSVDAATVADYAERMQAGDQFPPIDVYGTTTKCWPGDGWHRVMATRKCGATTIMAIVHTGDRKDAIRHALKANSAHGLRRTNADKKRSVAVALTEFGNLSSRHLAKICGVSHPFVEAIRQQAAGNTPGDEKRLGADGKERRQLETVTSSTPAEFDMQAVEVQLRAALEKLFSRCPVSDRLHLAQRIGTIAHAMATGGTKP